METADMVKVAVSAAPYSIDKPYSYLVPESLAAAAVPGVRVMVPFGRGNKESEGLILTRVQEPKLPGSKAIRQILDSEPVLDKAGIDLALWMRGRYFCTVFEAVKTILPAGLWYGLREIWSLAMEPEAARPAAVGIPGAWQVLDLLEKQGGKADIRVLRDALGDGAEKPLKAMKKAEILTCETDAKRKIADKSHRMVELAVNTEDAYALTEPKRRSAPARYEVVNFLATAGRTPAAEVSYYTGASARTLKAMEKAGLIAFSEEEELRVPSLDDVEPGPEIVLNEEQQRAFEEILGRVQAAKPSVTLLHGVTGSGKTQVYLRLVQETLALGKTAMVLVPEIVLTPQMMRKFSSYFGSRVAMLHSSLKMTERYDQWKRIRRGEVDVVLGTRSALFAPLKNLGLIIMDEEQEGSYQSENVPRYDAREVAKYLCVREKAALVFGSATPTVETAWAAEQGSYQKALLRRRYNENALPEVLIADLRQEILNGNPGLISTPLRQELEKNLAAGEQSILFLNRRGSSRMLLCGECGYVPQCPRCSTAMTYHSANERLMCHYCGHSEPAADTCPECGGWMKHIGAGTQKVEEELRELFPEAGILRMDADTTAGGHEEILQTFERERVPILLGTQMVAKGLDFENVTLVGVLSADISLYVDNYRAAERTFSLLTQVVGRAGRGGKTGRAVIQTYTPGNDVIRCAAQQDYDAFYESEIRMRRLRRYPPFADLFTVTVSGTEEGRVLRAAVSVRETLRQLCRRPELAAGEPEVLGPAPAPVVKVNNRFRYRCTLVGKNDKATREMLAWLQKTFAKDSANRGLNIFVDHNAAD
ncbi:primosomal protein N' [Dysosmobacter sp.]|uniref:replication restart helicase PriA n=1 Tax=Dysosmobacter sp. TaxID=2591382 RepID=UPI002A827F69|nr:primosomal protein N' [Dysosmobacter sp.]MCI7216031.1 primosomal protein N' [Dysosmobacter sp.]MDY3653299.1 primosomal protein N' [Dysosmobacter sp.]